MSDATLRLTLPPQVRLDHFLAKEFEETASRSQIQKWIKEGIVASADTGHPIFKTGYTSKEELDILISVPTPHKQELQASPVQVPIVFEDDHLAIVHKPAGMTVHPGAGTGPDTLVHSLIGQLDQISSGFAPDRPGIVHRLDRDTEGLLVVAKTLESHRRLAKLFADRKVRKVYSAWHFSRHLPETGEVTGKIGRHPGDRKKMLFLLQDQGANPPSNYREARMKYTVRKRLEDFVLTEIELITGRTHQIRAGFLAVKSPVVGDPIYHLKLSHLDTRNPLRSRKSKKDFEYGLLLFAGQLEFPHPFTGETIALKLPLPPRFQDFEKAITTIACA